MRMIIAGSRGITRPIHLVHALEAHRAIDIDALELIITGGAAGADQLGQRWAVHMGIDHLLMPADWQRYGRRAGYLRNVEMAKRADALLALWDGESRGTKHMIDIALDRDLAVFVHTVTN